MGKGDTTIRTADGKEYTGWRTSIDRALLSYGSSMPERQAILSGQIPISPAAASSLQRVGAVKRVEKPRTPLKSNPLTVRERRPKSWAAQNKLDAAVRRFSKMWTNFTQEMPDTEPEDAASDAALGFFFDNPEWETWARAAGVGGDYGRTAQGLKTVVHELVRDSVYDAMLKGAKRK